MEYCCSQCGEMQDENEFYPSDLVNAKDGKWTSCKKCHLARGVKSKRTLKRKIRNLYFDMKHRAKRRGLNSIKFKTETFIKWCYDNGIEKFYKDWVESGFESNKSPSIDRIYSTKDYTLDNIQLCTWEWNHWKRNHNDGLLFKDEIPF